MPTRRNLTSQTVTSSWGGGRPATARAFTEHGVAKYNAESLHGGIPHQSRACFRGNFSNWRLRRRAAPVGRVLQVARALVLRVLRIRADRPREAALLLLAKNLRRRLALLAPLLERRDRVERVRARAAAAVLHAGNEEHAHPAGL